MDMVPTESILVFLSGGNFGKQMSKYIYIGVILTKLKIFKEQLSFWPPIHQITYIKNSKIALYITFI